MAAAWSVSVGLALSVCGGMRVIIIGVLPLVVKRSGKASETSGRGVETRDTQPSVIAARPTACHWTLRNAAAIGCVGSLLRRRRL